jgi:ribosome maturation factor RimP
MVQLTELIETTVNSLGYELVHIEHAQGGALCVFIEQDTGISIDDCEKVSHQLQRVLTVEHIAYQRLEVSSPGLDRPLKKWNDFKRFSGHEAVIILKNPRDGRKQYKGVLCPLQDGTIRLTLTAPSGQHKAVEQRALDIALVDIERARLVPSVNFRSRKR